MALAVLNLTGSGTNNWGFNFDIAGSGYAGGSAYFSDLSGNFSDLLLSNGQQIANTDLLFRTFVDADVTTIPEPATLSMFAIGLAGLGVMSRRRRRKTDAA